MPRKGNIRKPLFTFLLLGALPVCSSNAQSFSILYHETVENPRFGPTAGRFAAAKPQDAFLSFQAFGRQFEVALEPNARLLVGQLAETRGVELYRGGLVGLPRSWARINRHGRDFSGVIFDGVELYVIERRHAVAGLLAAPRPADGATIVYRWSDTSGALVDDFIDPEYEQRPTAAALLEHLTADLPISPAKELDVGFVADFEFFQAFGATASAELLAIANIIDGIFAAQTGVFIAVPQVQVFSTSADPFSSAAPTTLLVELQSHKFATPELQTLGLAHLFTGRDLEELASSGGETVGFANLGVLCSARFGAGLTQATLGTSGTALVAAHEIGHNFGAPHDAEPGSACSATPHGFLMDGMLNFSPTFSQCSLEQMEPEITAATCLRDLAPNDLSLRLGSAPTDVMIGHYFEAEVILDSAPANDARRVTLNLAAGGATLLGVSGPSGWSCPLTGGAVLCTIDALPPARSELFRLTLQNTSEAPSLSADVAAANDPNTANNSIGHLFTVAPTADLVALATPNFVEAYLGEERTVTFTLHNERFGTAHDVTARIDSGSNHNLLEVTPSGGSCGPSEGRTWIFDCELGTIPVGDARTVAVRLRILEALRGDVGWELSNLWFDARATERDAAPDNNGTFASVVGAEGIVDIAASIAGPTDLAPGAIGRYTIRYTNNAPDTATDLYFEIRTPPIETSIESVVGDPTCTAVLIWFMYCTAPVLAPGQTLELTVSIQPTADGIYSVGTNVSQRQWDSYRNNNSTEVTLLVAGSTATPPPPPPPPPPPNPPPPSPPPPAPNPAPPATGGGGGGGSIDPGWLAWLLALVAFRHRWARARPRAH